MRNIESEVIYASDTANNEKLEAVKAQQEIVKIVKETGFSNYAETLDDLPSAFDLEKHRPVEEMHRCICCMDERTPYGVHSAGSGILLSDKDFDKYFKESKADSISSHNGCGAAKLYAKKMGFDVKDADRIGREWAEKKAKEKNVPYIHLEVDKSFHYARVCYYDGTGKFNHAGVKGLPAGFVVGREYMSKNSSVDESRIAEEIISTHIDPDEEPLNSENPFLFVVVAETKEEMEKLKEELFGLVGYLGDKVLIDGFIAPTLTINKQDD